MYLIKNKILYDSEGNALTTILNEIILTSDLIEDYITKESLDILVHSSYIVPLFKLLLLNPDETPREDITEYIVDDSLSYSHDFKSGQNRSVSVSILNKDGSWFPNPVNGKNWSGTKFQLYTGMVYKDIVFWFPSGIYYLSNPSLNMSEKVVSMQLIDKFAMLDGTIGGTTETEYKISVGDNVCDSIASLLKLDIGNGDIFDSKPFLYPMKHRNEKTPYTLDKNPESNFGEIILELSEMLSCETAYNEKGYLEMQDSDELLAIEDKPVILHITDEDIEMSGCNISIDYTKIINKVTVVGANVNGYIFDYTAVNDNPASPSSIMFTPPNFKYISDSNINSDDLCKERAEYELQKESFLNLSTSIPLVIWAPFIKAGDLIMWTSEEFGFKGVKFLVNSVNISGDGSISISIANIKELPF